MKELLKSYEEYLYSLKLRMRTVEGHLNNIKMFLEWLIKEVIKVEEVRQSDVLEYIRYCKEKGNKKVTIFKKVLSIKHLYNMLENSGEITRHPVINIEIRGIVKRQIRGTLNEEELAEIYETYQEGSLERKRNKIMLGLLIYQGIHSGELATIKIKDIDLEKGIIHLAKKPKIEARTLALKPHQLLPIQNYLEHIRPLLLAEKESELLFISRKSKYIKNSIRALYNQVKKQQPKIQALRQIRESVLIHWLKSHSLREVQYRAGHRYISSTEAYQTERFQSLQSQINRLHPLENPK